MELLSKDQFLREMVEKHADMVYRLALSRMQKKELAEDVFQEVFLRLSKKLPKFENEEHEKAWMIRVTINVSKSILTSAWFRKMVPLEEEVQFETKEQGEVYYEVINLPVKHRTILYLFYYEKFKLGEIAQMLKITEQNAKTKLYRAREELKTKLKGEFDDA